jgi:hypothetical protein
MRRRQLPLLVEQRRETEKVWSTMTEAERKQVTRCYAKVIGKAARCQSDDSLSSKGAQGNDAGK